MKKKIILNMLWLLALISFALYLHAKPEHNREYKLEPIKNATIDTCKVEVKVNVVSKFDLIHKAFVTYNPYVDSSSAKTFVDVMGKFNLGNDSTTLNLLIGQVLLESGAKQYYQPKHPKEGKLVESYAGAIGFCQILPSTAYGYLKKKMSDEDILNFTDLGATDFSFINSNKLSKLEKISLCREWLTNETNNIIMWGKIMSSKLEDKPILDALITYNAGTGELNKFLSNGNHQKSHKYIKGIMERLSYVGLTIS